MTTAEIFKNKMEQLTTDEIEKLMDEMWDKPESSLFLDAGFEIIEDRCGEDYSDSVYTILWNKHRK